MFAEPWSSLLVVAGFAVAWHVARVIVDQSVQSWRERKLEQVRARNDIDKFGFDMAFNRYEACRTILAEVNVEEDGIRAFVYETDWDEIKNRCRNMEDYQPIFVGDTSRSQLQKVCDESMHFLPTPVIDHAIAYLGSRNAVFLLTDAIMAPQFKSYDCQRKLWLLQQLYEQAKQQMEKTTPLACALDKACEAMAKALGEDYRRRY